MASLRQPRGQGCIAGACLHLSLSAVRFGSAPPVDLTSRARQIFSSLSPGKAFLWLRVSRLSPAWTCGKARRPETRPSNSLSPQECFHASNINLGKVCHRPTPLNQLHSVFDRPIPSTPNKASVIIGARWTPAAQCTNNLVPSSLKAGFAQTPLPERKLCGDFGSKSSSTGFQQHRDSIMPANCVSSNSICISIMCVIPARDAAPMFSGVQIPPPTPILSVTHVTSIPILSRVTRTFLPAGFFPEVPLPGCAAASAARSPFVSEPRRNREPRGSDPRFGVVASVYSTVSSASSRSPRRAFAFTLAFVRLLIPFLFRHQNLLQLCSPPASPVSIRLSSKPIGPFSQITASVGKPIRFSNV